MTKEKIIEDLYDRGLVFGIPPENEGVIKLDDAVTYILNQGQTLPINNVSKCSTCNKTNNPLCSSNWHHQNIC